ncbi:hypothetical protein [Streptomyces lonarensis]|uniref:Uncharacterized protein n=1 Tax=Streptomyces lonarensis TaxID=700599 RepID=A0A7X6D455_9ACTN|nr:hypothetical protein [Streptomyces lonarensis]NJQ07832.1 hypothetical protein [Streptomyces lonarensis]
MPWAIFLFAPPAPRAVFRLVAPVVAPGRALDVVDAALNGAMALSLPPLQWVVARLLAPDRF